jgi:hypothetical protein
MRFKMSSAGTPEGVEKRVNEWLRGQAGVAIRYASTSVTQISVEPKKGVEALIVIASVWTTKNDPPKVQIRTLPNSRTPLPRYCFRTFVCGRVVERNRLDRAKVCALLGLPLVDHQRAGLPEERGRSCHRDRRSRLRML